MAFVGWNNNDDSMQILMAEWFFTLPVFYETIIGFNVSNHRLIRILSMRYKAA